MTTNNDLAQIEASGLPARPGEAIRRTSTIRTVERNSALTFNAHRIHYDRDYAMREEGYPGLVVHGPLVATLLLDLVYIALPGLRVRRFDFRATRPLFDSAPFHVCARRAVQPNRLELWSRDADGFVTTEANLDYERL
jgi:3-methylfumaryl-CoA hydratase